MVFHFDPGVAGCCPCEICLDDGFEDFDDEAIGALLPSLDARWSAPAGTWTLAANAYPAAGMGQQWNTSAKTIETADSDALLVHDGPRKIWPITIQTRFAGHAAGDVLRLVFDYADADNYKFLAATIGAAPLTVADVFSPLNPGDPNYGALTSSAALHVGQIALWERVAGVETQVSPTVESLHLVPGAVYPSSEWRHLGVSMTRLPVGDDGTDPQLMITGFVASWPDGYTYAQSSYRGTASSPACGLATGTIAGTIQFDTVTANWSPNNGDCYAASPLMRLADPPALADATAVDVTAGTIVSGMVDHLWHTQIQGTDWPDLVLAPDAGQLAAEFTFRLVNPKPSAVLFQGGYLGASLPNLPGGTVEGDGPYLAATVLNWQLGEWEPASFGNNYTYDLGRTVQTSQYPFWFADGQPETPERLHPHWFGFTQDHVGADGLLKLRLTSDAEHYHGDDNRLAIRFACAFNQSSYPAQYRVTVGVQPGYSTIPDFVGTHTLTRQEGFAGTWVALVSGEPGDPLCRYIAIEPVIDFTYGDWVPPSGLTLVVYMIRVEQQAGRNYHWVEGRGFWNAALDGRNNSLWVNGRIQAGYGGALYTFTNVFISAVGSAP